MTALRVLEASGGIAGAYAGWLLSRCGAEVVCVDTGAATAADDATPLARERYRAGKPAFAGGGVEALAGFDAVLTDSPDVLPACLGVGIDELRARFPAMIVGVASAFGVEGAAGAGGGGELAAQAVSGLSWVLGAPDREPLTLPYGVLEHQAGVHLAAASLLALIERRRSGAAPFVDIALADILAAYVGTNATFYVYHGLRWERAGRRAYASGGSYPLTILPCKDGQVCFVGRTKEEWVRLVEAMGAPDWTREPRYQSLRAMGQQYPDEVDARLSPWLSRRTRDELEALISRYRLTAAPLRTFDEVVTTPQFAFRGSLEPTTLRGETVVAPALPFRVHAERRAEAPDRATGLLSQAGGAGGPREASVAHDRVTGRPLAGLRVLDYGWVWSAPWVSGMLAEFGAEVIKVEHAGRLDNSRLSPRVVRDGVRLEGPTTEMSPMFHQINHGKKGITLNLKDPRAIEIALALAESSDVVIENMAPGAMERAGLGYSAQRSRNPRLVMLSMSGAGQFGPLADMRTYAPLMSAFVGLDALVGYPHETAIGCVALGLGDPNASAHGLLALLAALVHRRDTGEGCYIDLSQVEALLCTLTPTLLRAQVDRSQPAPMGNGLPHRAPRGYYPAQGANRWIGLEVRDDPEWQRFAAVVGEPWARDVGYATVARRVAERAGLDRRIGEWSRRFDRDELVGRLSAAGVRAAPVLSWEEQAADARFVARGLRAEVEVPCLGRLPIYKTPWRCSGIERSVGAPGPRLGEHNREVLRGLLGVGDESFERWVAEGVVS